MFLHREPAEGEDFVSCRICGLSRLDLTQHVKRHGLGTVEYLSTYPDASLIAENAPVKLKRRGKKQFKEVIQPVVTSPEIPPAPPPTRKPSVFTVNGFEIPIRFDLSPDDSQFVPQEQFFLPDPLDLKMVARAILGDEPVLLIGETGTGKTSLIRHLAAKTRNPFRRINLNGQVGSDEILGKYLLKQGETVWVDGVVVDALRRGHWLLIDEVNAALPETLFALHSLLDEDRMIVLAEKDGEVVRPHPCFRLFAAMNPPDTGLYGGTKLLNAAFLDRFPICLRVGYLEPETELRVLLEHVKLPKPQARKMVEAANRIREAIQNQRVYGDFSTRKLIAWGKVAQDFGIVEAAQTTILNKADPNDAEVIKEILEALF